MKLRAPVGYRVHVWDKTIRSIAYDGTRFREPISLNVDLKFQNEVVGYVEVLRTIKGFWETHSHIDEEHRNRGLGVLLYGKAIDIILKRGFEIRSSNNPSMSARYVWESKRLNGLYVIKRTKIGYVVVERR